MNTYLDDDSVLVDNVFTGYPNKIVALNRTAISMIQISLKISIKQILYIMVRIFQ